ncbi:MAG: hypothetical protein ACO23H_17155 [Alphaproteobacteria bacterium]
MSTEMPKKIWTRDEIDALLMRSDNAVMRAIIRIFELQTLDEQTSTQTKHENGRGFSSADAKAGTLFAQYLLGFDKHNVKRWQPKPLTHPHANKVFQRYTHGGTAIQRARKIALKHSAQLVRIANS